MSNTKNKNKKKKSMIDTILDYRHDKSIELFGYPESGLTPEEEDKLDRYIRDISNPLWKIIVVAKDGTKCQISNIGKVKDINGKSIKAYYNSSYYETVWIRSDVDPKRCYPKLVHRLVAEAFIPNPENKPEVNHINNKTTINWVGNLEWVTHKENISHTIDSGNQVVGVDHKNSKWTEDQIRRVCELLENPNAVIRDISKETGVSIKTINHIRFDGGWKHISKDYDLKVPRRNPGPRYSPLSLAIRDKIQEGKTNEEIITELNKSGLSSGVSNKSISDRIWYIRTKLL